MHQTRHFPLRDGSLAATAAQQAVVNIFEQEGLWPVRVLIASTTQTELNGSLPIRLGDNCCEIPLERSEQLPLDVFALCLQ